MTKNEIVARWMNLYYEEVHGELLYTRGEWGYEAHNLEYDKSYDWLHEAWVKFRDLKYKNQELADDHFHWCNSIHTAIGYLTITEAFDELVKGIEWYESLKK